MAQRYNSPLPMQIDPNKHYEAVFHTQQGDLIVQFFVKQALVTTNNFIFLAVNS